MEDHHKSCYYEEDVGKGIVEDEEEREEDNGDESIEVEDWEKEIIEFEEELEKTRKAKEKERMYERAFELYQQVLTRSRLGINKERRKSDLKDWFEGPIMDPIDEVCGDCNEESD